MLITNGNSETWVANNIYNLAGNLWEWTIEASKDNGRVLRGGHSSNSGSYFPVAARSDNAPTYGATTYGSRSVLYIDIPEPEDGPTYASTTEIQDDLGNKIVIPGGFHLDKDSGKNVEDGIVIEDDDGNQFVWIPTGTYNVTEAVDNDGTKDGKLTNNLSRREWAPNDVVREPTEVENYEAVSTYYYGEEDQRSGENVKIGMFKDSVNKNGGFYIGRYEQGTGNICKEGVTPYTGINKDPAQEQAEAMYDENIYVTSELISSYAWDTALNFICQTNSEGYKLATTTDRNYGNFYPGSQQNTGVYEADNYSNIHDMLGNCCEWTTEYSTFKWVSDHYYDVNRGGFYNASGYVAATRMYTGFKDANVSQRRSFRVQLYIK